jgi:hypothetical protein
MALKTDYRPDAVLAAAFLLAKAVMKAAWLQARFFAEVCAPFV